MSFAIVRTRTEPANLHLDSFARIAGVHPDLVRRLYALGVLEGRRDAAGELWFPPAEVATVARIQRLRAGLSLNYAAAGLVVDLLDRIAELEAAARQLRRARSRNTGG
jgi:hypothetical protein